ncbi:MAG: hypothetical protein P8J30_01075 [Ilumatobacter sp.]|nr:hypothetical protein [Ilumatobacter sp.]
MAAFAVLCVVGAEAMLGDRRNHRGPGGLVPDKLTDAVQVA